jgi:hypothetical protein
MAEGPEQHSTATMVGFGISENICHFMMFAIILELRMGLAFTSVAALIAEVVRPKRNPVADKFLLLISLKNCMITFPNLIVSILNK